jgi:hypothetical protein
MHALHLAAMAGWYHGANYLQPQHESNMSTGGIMWQKPQGDGSARSRY